MGSKFLFCQGEAPQGKAYKDDLFVINSEPCFAVIHNIQKKLVVRSHLHCPNSSFHHSNIDSQGVFRTHLNIYDGAFYKNN